MAHHLSFAGVAELADALDLGSSVLRRGVRVPSPALYLQSARKSVLLG